MSRAIQTPSPAKLLEDAYGIKGKIALQLDENVIPVHVLQTDQLREYSAAYAWSSLAAGGAGFRSFVTFETAVPDKPVYVYRVMLRSTGTAQFQIFYPTGNHGSITTLTPQWQDRRKPGTPACIVFEKNTSALPAGTVAATVYAPASSAAVYVDLELVLPPQLEVSASARFRRQIIICPAVNNVDFQCALFWREPPDAL